MVRSNAPSEFGGGPGRVQRQPHDPAKVASEYRRLVVSTDSTDPGDSPEAVLAREWDRERRTGELPE